MRDALRVTTRDALRATKRDACRVGSNGLMSWREHVVGASAVCESVKSWMTGVSMVLQLVKKFGFLAVGQSTRAAAALPSCLRTMKVMKAMK